jgi:hypothetical protein
MQRMVGSVFCLLPVGRFAMAHRILLSAITVVLLAAGPAGTAPGAEKGGITLPPKPLLHVYLLMGQSNMSGRGYPFKEDRKVNERLISLDRENHWVPAVEPLHWDKQPGVVGVGPGRAFAEAMLLEAPEGVTIAVVPCAETGSPLSRWEKGGDLYGRALLRARRAIKDGTIKGILWHHGETDAATYTLATTYGDRLKRMVIDFRKELGQGDVPFVCGEITPLLPFNRFPAHDKVNASLKELPKKLSMCDCVPVDGLTLLPDGIHFDTRSARILGKRYATELLDLQRKANRP